MKINLKKCYAVCFDFDGVIHKYSKGWQDGTIYDGYNSKVLSLIRVLTQIGVPVFICSTRNPQQIKEWWDKQGFTLGAHVIDETTLFWEETKVIGITNRKLPAQVYIDDRAYLYTGQTVKEFFMDFSIDEN